VTQKQSIVGKFVLFAVLGLGAGLSVFWGKVFFMPLIIAVVIFFFPRFVGVWFTCLMAICGGVGFGLIRGFYQGLIAAGIAVVISLLFLWFSMSIWKKPAVSQSSPPTK
jgi:hypothetical protein